MISINQHNSDFQISYNLRIAYLVTLIVTLFMIIVSGSGLIFQSAIYPTDELQRTFVPNDVVNLLIGVPILLGSLWFTFRGKLIGLLLWPGALLYVFYNYIAYLFAMPLNFLYVLYLGLVTSSAYTIIGLVAAIDGSSTKNQLQSHVPERLAGGVIFSLGLLFLIRVIAMVILAVANETLIDRSDLSVLIADFMVSPAMIAGGILLWQQKALGYVSGTGLLFQLSMLFIGLIIFMVLQPVMTSEPFILTDIIIVLIMGLVCFIPFGLFIRGVISTGR
jgi:hypothetical protein